MPTRLEVRPVHLPCTLRAESGARIIGIAQLPQDPLDGDDLVCIAPVGLENMKIRMNILFHQKGMDDRYLSHQKEMEDRYQSHPKWLDDDEMFGPSNLSPRYDISCGSHAMFFFV